MSAPNRCSIRSTASLFLLTWSPWQLRQCGQHRLYLLLEPECPVTHHPDKSFHRFHTVISKHHLWQLQHHTHQEVSLLGASGPQKNSFHKCDLCVTQVSCGKHTCRVGRKVLARGLGRRIGGLTLHWDLKEVLHCRSEQTKQIWDNKPTNASHNNCCHSFFFASSPKFIKKTTAAFRLFISNIQLQQTGLQKGEDCLKAAGFKNLHRLILAAADSPCQSLCSRYSMIWVVNFTKCQEF